MLVNSINMYNKYIGFKSNPENNSNVTNMPRSQHQNNIHFEKESKLVQKADSVDANPITALGYKLYRTFRIISEHEPTQSELDALNMYA